MLVLKLSLFAFATAFVVLLFTIAWVVP